MNVFAWLDEESKATNFHLIPLNLAWSDAGMEHDLTVFRRVAERLAVERAYWSELLREDDWRLQLVGCACLLASRRPEFFDDLCHRFCAGSFVAPQIAVTLGLLHGTAARSFFESVLEDAGLRARPKQAASAYRVLQRLGAPPRADLAIESWQGWDHDDALTADQVVARQWDFWSKRA